MVFPKDQSLAHYFSIANYAEDNTPYTTNDDLTKLLEILENETNILFEWFKINEMKPNADKCHLIVANQKNSISVNIGGEATENEPTVELLGIKINNKLNFSEHVSKLCKRVIRNFMRLLESQNT